MIRDKYLQTVSRRLSDGTIRKHYYARVPAKRSDKTSLPKIRIPLGTDLEHATRRLRTFHKVGFPIQFDGHETERVKAAIRRAVSNSKARSKKKGLEWDLSYEILLSILRKQNFTCAVSGIPFSYEKGNWGKGRNPYGVSLDRIDSRQGYFDGNVRLVTVAVNYALSDWGELVFFEICEATRTHQRRNKSRSTM